ncbi:unnamed protein product [Pleuronectes platessa]|uniref:Uncharacterized protein n=1 Tax=Pleuronectes platessa TaxID=8262 RepID=A0A9N7Z197_PLEPL|nr:unnamed protein product [Pleuronectes platessa]
MTAQGQHKRAPEVSTPRAGDETNPQTRRGAAADHLPTAHDCGPVGKAKRPVSPHSLERILQPAAAQQHTPTQRCTQRVLVGHIGQPARTQDMPGTGAGGTPRRLTLRRAAVAYAKP